MKLSILGTPYDYGRALQRAKLTDLAALKMAADIGPRAIYAMLFKLFEAEPEDRAAISEDTDVLIATQGLVFLCRRHAGDKVSYEDSAVAWEDLEWVVEDSDVESQDEPPPLSAAEASADSVNGSKSNGSTRSSKKSTTSKTRSIAASS